MGLGIGIALLVVGGILAFGVRDQWSAVDLTAIGYVCLAVGVLSIILVLILQSQRRKTSHTSVVERRNVGGSEPPLT
jgi:membrane protein DedA with SNARE-associated domain